MNQTIQWTIILNMLFFIIITLFNRWIKQRYCWINSLLWDYEYYIRHDMELRNKRWKKIICKLHINKNPFEHCVRQSRMKKKKQIKPHWIGFRWFCVFYIIFLQFFFFLFGLLGLRLHKDFWYASNENIYRDISTTCNTVPVAAIHMDVFFFPIFYFHCIWTLNPPVDTRSMRFFTIIFVTFPLNVDQYT